MNYKEHYKEFIELGYSPIESAKMAHKAVQSDTEKHNSPDYEAPDLSNGLET